MSRVAADAYTDVEKITASGRQLEASALFRAARALQVAQESWGQEGTEQRLEQALQLNQRLWTFFQAELSADDNPLPLELKANLLSLVEYIDKRTFEVMAAPAAEKLNVLVAINRNVAAGLASQPSGVAA